MEGVGRPGRRCKQLLDDLKEKRRCWSYKIALCGELTLEAAMDLSQDILHNECINESIIKWMQLNILIVHTQEINTLLHLYAICPVMS
jgi:hypothetical protein